jgi:toxin-antitoxin system PIN domain toxin
MIALDTNILVHAHRRDASLHDQASALVKKLAESPTPWGVCYHSLVEFYGVATRRGIWESPSTPAAAFDQIDTWRESPSLRVLHDTEDSPELLKELALAGSVIGGMIHDARVAACCLGHGIDELWTVDRDFSRFPRLRHRNPLADAL